MRNIIPIFLWMFCMYLLYIHVFNSLQEHQQRKNSLIEKETNGENAYVPNIAPKDSTFTNNERKVSNTDVINIISDENVKTPIDKPLDSDHSLVLKKKNNSNIIDRTTEAKKKVNTLIVKDIEKKPVPNVITNQNEIYDLEREHEPVLIKIPPKHILDIPFFAQAPDGNRNQPRQDTCEEASIVLSAYWLNNKPLSKNQFIQDVQDLIGLQNNIFGSYIDTNVAQTKKLFDIYYGIGTSKIIDNPTIADLRNEIATGNPIVAPFAGKLLGNIYYSNGGPVYHMLVIVGYDELGFYTHDVGTKHGRNYWYSNEILLDALHDLPENKNNIQAGRKRVLIFKK